MNKEKSPLVQYAELLSKHRSSSAKPVRDFFDGNRHDTTFIRRAKTLNKLFHSKGRTS